ncbi:hypothetical protein BGZ76_010183 [Entomortierella beljakovae]|nr:hypothetical protein BGZ76_010183 [Entomortierella beljakovae]
MPTHNAIFGSHQPSVVFHGAPINSSSDVNPLNDHKIDTISYQEQQSSYSPLQNHVHGLNHSRSNSHLIGTNPDPAVMEFISKIGQIIIKARTVSPTIPFGQPTSGNRNGSDSSSSNNSSLLQQQNLDMVLQDTDLWRNNTPVHINILHTAQYALLERWVISYTPPTVPISSPIVQNASTRSAKSPYSNYISPKSKHLLPQASRSPLNPSIPPVSASPKDTTDLVLLLQSLYTQIRSLPLQNCLTSFDDKTKLAKSDLAYSVTSAHEDITQPRQDRVNYASPNAATKDITADDPPEDKYAAFTSSIKSALPLEFVQAASLKVINYEASHLQWGCVRVTGMYDESVGNRISPENFQDSTKIQKKRQHRSKPSHSSDSTIKATRKHQKDTFLVSSSKPGHSSYSSSSLSTEQNTSTLQKDTPNQTDKSSYSVQRECLGRGLYPSNSEVEDPEQVRLQELKKNNDRLFSLMSSDSQTRSTLPSPNQRDQQPYRSILQESPLPKYEAGPAASATLNQESMQAYKFPPHPSPPLSIPTAKKSGADKTPASSPIYSESESEATPNNGYFAPGQQQHSSAFQYSPPYLHQSYQHNHSPFSTSPLARVITRRRSSRLSIVMTCNDDSPEATRPQSPSTTADKENLDYSMEDNSETPQPYQSLMQFRRRGSLQDQKFTIYSENHGKPPLGQSPTRSQLLRRRSSLNPSSFTHGDLFGSLVGSYEESILSGRMSTLPSKPLIFTAQIGVLANQDYKDCPPKLSLNMTSVYGPGPSSLSHSLSSHSVPTAQDDPILPYVGNLDLDSGFRGSRRFARMPGGMRIPLRGQVQVMIKNPNKTVVKVFLVPYDFMDMPAGTKTFLRQKYYSTGPGMGPVSTNPNNGGTLRYAIHLQFCCPAPGYVYLYRSIRVVFANRVPDGKESLRVVLEGLGMGIRTIGEHGKTRELASSTCESSQPTSKNLEERYVKMRKREVSFCKRKKDMDLPDDLPIEDDDMLSSTPRGLGLSLNREFPAFHQQPHQLQQSLNFDRQTHGNTLYGSQTPNSKLERSQPGGSFLMSSPKRTLSGGPLDVTLDNAVSPSLESKHEFQLGGNAPAFKSPGMTSTLGNSSSSSSITNSPVCSQSYFGSGSLSFK